MKYPNFYENIKEAQMRLRGTVVLYDGVPYYIMAITQGNSDGIFRVYLDPVGRDPTVLWSRPNMGDYNMESPNLAPYLDSWMLSNPNSGILRKHINSPAFNKFRPYPLGMCNFGVSALYIERQPNRKTEQGLIRSMLEATPINLIPTNAIAKGGCPVDTYSVEFKSCILADHPSADTVLNALNDPTIQNTAIAFHRNFAMVRGPIGMIFLAYKTDIIGVMPNSDFSRLRLGSEFAHTREVIEKLNLFSSIMI